MRLSCLIVVGAVAAGGCSSSVEPSAVPVTLRVNNTTCSPGPCVRLTVVGLPSNQPNTPGGPWALPLGVSTTPTMCVTIPATAHFYVIQVPGYDTTTTTWTSVLPISIGVRRDSTLAFQVASATSDFVPIAARGWSVDVPDGAKAIPGDSCTP